MNSTNESRVASDLRRQMRETMDLEWIGQGSSKEDLEISRRLSDLYACELASGRTPEEIGSAWQGKSATDILQEYCLPVRTLANDSNLE